jgi:importin subunit beta-1
VIIHRLGDSQDTKAVVLQHADSIMNVLLQIFSLNSASVHEEAMMAVGGAAVPLTHHSAAAAAAAWQHLCRAPCVQAGAGAVLRGQPPPHTGADPPLRMVAQVGAFTYACGKQFTKYLQPFFPHLIKGLRTHQEWQNCLAAVGATAASPLCCSWARRALAPR